MINPPGFYFDYWNKKQKSYPQDKKVISDILIIFK